jgi:hypothetical protein
MCFVLVCLKGCSDQSERYIEAFPLELLLDRSESFAQIFYPGKPSLLESSEFIALQRQSAKFLPQVIEKTLSAPLTDEKAYILGHAFQYLDKALFVKWIDAAIQANAKGLISTRGLEVITYPQLKQIKSNLKTTGCRRELKPVIEKLLAHDSLSEGTKNTVRFYSKGFGPWCWRFPNESY